MSLLFPLQTGKAAAEVADLHKRDTGLICPPDREQGNSKKKKEEKTKKRKKLCIDTREAIKTKSLKQDIWCEWKINTVAIIRTIFHRKKKQRQQDT